MENNIEVVEKEQIQVANFIIELIKENPFAVAFGAMGICIGILIDDRRRIRKMGGK
jgi:hypothetical protein